MAHHRRDEHHAQPAPAASSGSRIVRGTVAIIGGLLLVVAAVSGAHALYSAATGSSPTSSSTLTPAQQQGTPLGCPANGDPQCVDRTLAHDVCDVDLDPNLPPTYQSGNMASTVYTRGDNSSIGLSVSSQWTRGNVTWQCADPPLGVFHYFNFTHQEWVDLHTDGAPLPSKLVGLIPPK